MTQQAKLNNILELLEQITSLSVVQEFLKRKGLRHSAGSWTDMRDKRLLPALEDNSIDIGDLIELLRYSEECGRQHVFLYKCTKKQALELMDRGRIAATLRRKNLSHLAQEADVLLEPKHPIIVDVRWEGVNVDSALVIKEVETRERRKYARTEIIGNYLHKIYEYSKQRAVNVAKLHSSGFLEIRIASHTNTTKYDGDLVRFFTQIQDFFPSAYFSELSLTTAKDKFWTDRENLRSLIRYTNAIVCNVDGNLLHASTGSDQSDLSGDTNIGKSLDLLLEQDADAFCKEANLWFRKIDNILSTDIHVLLDGEINEFALPGNCSPEDYQYVLSQIRHHNR